MKALIIIEATVIFLCAFGYYSYHCALKDKYIKHSTEERIFMWKRDFGNPVAATSTSFSAWESPFVLIKYWINGRHQVKEWKDFFNRNIADRPLDEVLPFIVEQVATNPEHR